MLGAAILISSLLLVSSQKFNNTSLATISDTLIASGNHSILVSLLNATGVLETLNTTGVNGTGYEVYAPIDSAFLSLPSWIRKRAQHVGRNESINLLRAALIYHASLPANVDLTNFTTNATMVPTLASGIPMQLESNSTSGNSYVNDAKVLNATNTTNGGLLAIDRVLSPLYFFNTSLYDIPNPPPNTLPYGVPTPNLMLKSDYSDNMDVTSWYYTNVLGTFKVHSPEAVFQQEQSSDGYLNDLVKSLGL
ncbi:hypothetical protein SmJEL517_g01282 [Synchytrium microbalum]|uniref:FAS1 domain-containing protein n=1 Tax=Synchytrium microbalum TaxID=1806994 RepID=A0A507CC43_9FUNG|nr:uncharacterized protein SmJEL517_g01282 [Synchytrium microbalum]TPX36739.1 hypothetical protein SmJEL517_g01282 [Synchytrium microbalum]